MSYYMYVAVQEDNKISVFTVDPQTGGLTHQDDVPVPGRALYPSDQSRPQLSLCRLPGTRSVNQFPD